MLDQIIRYLTGRLVPFRVLSYPMPEPAPDVAPQHARFGRLVDTHIVLADGRPALAVVPAGAPVDVLALGQELGTAVLEGSAEDLPAPFTGMRGVPPLGGLLGLPLIVETRVPQGTLLFRTFIDDHSESFVEVVLDDLERVERPRSATFSIAGALPAFAGDDGPTVSVAVGGSTGKPAKQARSPGREATGNKRETTGNKRESTGNKREVTANERQATASKRQATASKRQAAAKGAPSSKRRPPVERSRASAGTGNKKAPPRAAAPGRKTHATRGL